MKSKAFSNLLSIDHAARRQPVPNEYDPGRLSKERILNSAPGCNRHVPIRNQLLELIFRQVPQGIVVCDTHGNITLLSTAARKLLQTHSKETSLQHAPGIRGELFDSDGRRIPPWESPCGRALLGEVTIDKQCRVGRFGVVHDILISAAPVIYNERVVAAVTTFAECAKRKQEELLLREAAVSKERRRMAADLHDTLAPSLYAIVLLLETAEYEFPANLEQIRRDLKRARDMARDCMAEARRSMWTLSHDSLENDQLGSALSFLAKQFFAGTPIKLKLSLQQGSIALSTEMRRELLRIAREALTNVVKHAKATTVRIALAYKERLVQLRVRDDGRGFANGAGASFNGNYGLDNMRYRTEQLGGTFVVDSQPGRGTHVMASLPLPPKVVQWAAGTYRRSSFGSRPYGTE
jgi:signal transduction histidine kinase